MLPSPRLTHFSRRNQESVIKLWFIENQIGVCLFLLIPLVLMQCISLARHSTNEFFFFSYYNDTTQEYGLGVDDAYMVFFFVALLTGLRAGTMRHVLVPFAKSRGLSTKKSIRFGEQAWMVLYYLVFWPMGFYIYAVSPYWLNLQELWTNWPNRETTTLMKAYILVQLAFWLHQIIIINIEQRRKDHWQMFTHHIITIALVYCSYRYGHTRVGNVVLVLMDVTDLFFSSAKCLKYLGMQKLCDLMFGSFVISWIFCRHIMFGMVCWSVYAHTPHAMTTGCFFGSGENISDPVSVPANSWDYLLGPLVSNSGSVCYSPTIKLLFLGGLLFLQGIMILWFVMIFKLAVRVLLGQNAEDTRSDDEEDEEVHSETECLINDAVGPQGPNLRASRHGKMAVRPSIHHRPGAVGTAIIKDRQIFLDRIGCEKKIE